MPSLLDLLPLGYRRALSRGPRGCTAGARQLSVLCVHASSLSRVQLFETPWTVSRQAPLFVGFSRQEYWKG